MRVDCRRDARPGPRHFLVVGLGGIQAESLDDVVLFPASLDTAIMRDRIAGSRLAHLLASATASDGQKVIDRILAMLRSLQGLLSIAADVVVSIDLNPVIVTAPGDCVAVDALIVLRDPAAQ